MALEWFQRHVLKNKHRSADEVERFMRQHLLKAFPEMEITAVKRVDVTRLLDDLEDNHGKRTADEALSTLRRIFNWYALRDQNFQHAACNWDASAQAG